MIVPYYCVTLQCCYNSVKFELRGGSEANVGHLIFSMMFFNFLTLHGTNSLVKCNQIHLLCNWSRI